MLLIFVIVLTEFIFYCPSKVFVKKLLYVTPATSKATGLIDKGFLALYMATLITRYCIRQGKILIFNFKPHGYVKTILEWSWQLRTR